MTDDEFLKMIIKVITLNEDDAKWLLAAADSIVLADAQITLQRSIERIGRELERRRV